MTRPAKAPRKPKPPKLLPDSRLRIERRPAWLGEPFECDIMLFHDCRGSHALAIVDQLVAKIEQASAGDEHPIRPHTIDHKRCRVCHCTGNCIGCVNLTGDACSWSPEDPTVCTACVIPKKEVEKMARLIEKARGR